MSLARHAITAAIALGALSPAAAQDAPWDVTGTSSVAIVPELAPGHRVERRRFVKKQHLVVRTGFAYLARGDFYTNPGVGLDVSWYPEESIAIDLASATFFFSQLTTTAANVRRTTGLLPDSQKPIARVTSGVRFAFAYGKLLIEELDTVVHVDAGVALHLGVLVTDVAPNFGGDLGLGLQVRTLERVLVWLEAGWFGSYEERTSSSFASGPMATIGLGIVL